MVFSFFLKIAFYVRAFLKSVQHKGHRAANKKAASPEWTKPRAKPKWLLFTASCHIPAILYHCWQCKKGPKIEPA